MLIYLITKRSKNMEADKIHIRHCIRYECAKIVNGTHKPANYAKFVAEEINKTYGAKTVSETTCRDWMRKFSNGQMDVSDDPRTGRPSIVDEEKLQNLLDEDDSLTAEEIALELKCSRSTAWEHLHAMKKVWKFGCWVPHMLTDVNKQQRVIAATELLRRYESKQLALDDIVTQDESWILYVNVDRKHHWVDCGATPKPTAKPGLYPKKIQLSIWWCTRGVIYWKLYDKGSSINKETYCAELREMNELLRKMKEKPREHAYIKDYFLLVDNATPHTAKATQKQMDDLKLIRLTHPAYSPDLAPSDYSLFRSLKNHLRGKSFKTKQELESELKNFFSAKDAEFYRRAIKQLPSRWREIIETGGEFVAD